MTQPNKQTTVLFVRHGETDANASGTWQGSTDSPLNDRGHLQAQAVAQRLHKEAHIDVIYSSPLERARETAEIIAGQVGTPPIQLDPDLAEFHLGEWEGLTYEELRLEKKLWDLMGADPTFTPPGGESAVDFATRLLRSVQRIVGQHPGETILIASHGGAIATVLAMLLERDGQHWPKYQMANCALSELTFNPVPDLIRLNEKTHLQEVGALGEWD